MPFPLSSPGKFLLQAQLLQSVRKFPQLIQTALRNPLSSLRITYLRKNSMIKHDFKRHSLRKLEKSDFCLFYFFLNFIYFLINFLLEYS